MDEQFDPGGRYHVVDHDVKPGWDGPGLIHSMRYGMSPQEAQDLADSMVPSGPDAVAVRVLDRQTNTWLDDGTEAFR